MGGGDQQGRGTGVSPEDLRTGAPLVSRARENGSLSSRKKEILSFAFLF